MNLRFYALAGLATLIGVVWLLADGALRAGDLGPLVLSLSNMYGLLIVCLLLGYGLVDIPRSLWRLSNSEGALARCHKAAVEADESLFDARCDVQDVLRDVQALAHLAQPHTAHTQLVHAVATLQSLPPPELGSGGGGAATGSSGSARRRGAASPSQPTHEPRGWVGWLCGEEEDDFGGLPADVGSRDAPGLLAAAVGVHRRLLATLAAYRKARSHWNMLVRSALYHEGVAQQQRSAVPPGSGGLQARLSWWWHVRLAPVVFRVVAIVAALASVLVLVSELMLPFSANSPSRINPIGRIAYIDETASPGTVLAVAVVLAYMSAAMYSALFKLRAFGMLELCPGGNTDATTLLLNAGILCRLQFALAFNYLNMADLPWRTSFSETLGADNKLSAVDVYLPISILCVAVITAGRCVGRVSGWFGADQPDLADTDSPEGQRLEAQGRALLNKGRRRLSTASRSLPFEEGTLPTAGGGGAPARSRHDDEEVNLPTPGGDVHFTPLMSVA